MIISCLICNEEIVPQIGWNYLFSKQEPQYLCEICINSFTLIDGDTCNKCSRPLGETEYKQNNLCLDCVRWEADPKWKGCLERNDSLVTYSDFCKESIARFKFRGDYILSYAFASLMKGKLNSLQYDQLTSIPLSDERLYERGFNQSEAIIIAMGAHPESILARTHTEKQSKKSRSERIHLPQVFKITKPDKIKHKKILIIDDIYTTGSTLHHAAKLLKEAGAESVSSFTIARG